LTAVEQPDQSLRLEYAGRPGGYELCEFYYFRLPTLRPGFQPAQGGLIVGAAELWPEAWAYLQTAEGQLLRKTEAEWQAMITAVWHTNADGSTVGWDGIGGAPFYVQDLAAGTLRLPDLRGMHIEAAGGGLGVGDVDGDRMRRITGSILPQNENGSSAIRLEHMSGALYRYPTGFNCQGDLAFTPTLADSYIRLDTGRVAPHGPRTAPARWGALACVYLGLPAS
jgi:hypothetical protein